MVRPMNDLAMAASIGTSNAAITSSGPDGQTATGRITGRRAVDACVGPDGAPAPSRRIVPIRQGTACRVGDGPFMADDGPRRVESQRVGECGDSLIALNSSRRAPDWTSVAPAARDGRGRARDR